MNFTQQWISARAVGKELVRALSDGQLPFVQAVMGEMAKGGVPANSLLQTIQLVRELRTSAGTAPAEHLVKDALQGLSNWMIAVRNGEFPDNSALTQYARQLAGWLAEQAQTEDSRRRASELVTQLTLPAFEWLSRTLVEHQMASSNDPLRDDGCAEQSARKEAHE
jgi:hypothetical protein